MCFALRENCIAISFASQGWHGNLSSARAKKPLQCGTGSDCSQSRYLRTTETGRTILGLDALVTLHMCKAGVHRLYAPFHSAASCTICTLRPLTLCRLQVEDGARKEEKHDACTPIACAVRGDLGLGGQYDLDRVEARASRVSYLAGSNPTLTEESFKERHTNACSGCCLLRLLRS